MERYVDALMECCTSLVRRAGQDLAGSMPYGAFRDWCANNPDQASRIIDEARAGKDRVKDFVTFALHGANDIKQAVAFVEEFTDERCLYAMTALGRMIFPDEGAARKVLAVLEPLTGHSWDDRVRANALAASFGILAKHPDLLIARRIVESAGSGPGADMLYTLAQMLFQRQVTLDLETTRIALSAMRLLGKDHPGTVGTLSHALCRMLETPEEVLALDALSEMLDCGARSVEDFRTVFHKISSGAAERRQALAVRWLLSGSVRLGDAVSELVPHSQSGWSGLDWALPLLSDDEQVFLCRKAVAFLFMHPKSCCEVLVAVLRNASARVCDVAVDLLVNPMMISYGGLQKYVATVSEADSAHVHIQVALERFVQYRATLDAISDVKELRPTERQRHVARMRSRDEMREAFKGAERSSVLQNLFHRSHVLFGRRTLTFIEDLDGTRRAIPLDLNSHSTSIEMPSLEWLDPVGLDYMLRSWRVMRQP